jgi:hypothetical protein
MYFKSSWPEIMAAFPGMTHWQLAGKARHIGLRGRRPRLKPAADSVCNAILQRVAQRGWSLVDLDEIAGTRQYFRREGWRYNAPKKAALWKAIEALDGEVSITWRD